MLDDKKERTVQLYGINLAVFVTTRLILFPDIMNNCARDGGYCINVIPPQPPRRRMPRRKGTRTRKGKRRGLNAPKPDPAALGQQHTRLPAGAAAAGANAGAGVAGQQQPAASNSPFSFLDSLFGPPAAGGADPFASMFGMSMFFRKKRQAPGYEPGEVAEIPRIRRGENMYNFLNTHCRKSEFDFGCRNTGGMCCLPHL